MLLDGEPSFQSIGKSSENERKGLLANSLRLQSDALVRDVYPLGTRPSAGYCISPSGKDMDISLCVCLRMGIMVYIS